MTVGEDRTYKRTTQTPVMRQRLMTLVRIVRAGICEAIEDEKRLEPRVITAKNKRLLAQYETDFKFDFVETRFGRYAWDTLTHLGKDMFHYYRHGTTPHEMSE